MEISVSGLNKNYKNFEALKNIDFEAKSGEVLGVLGVNGAGKTTLLRILTGIIDASSGSIKLGNALISYASIITNIGYLPEERGLYKNMKAVDCVLFLASLKNISRQQTLQFIQEKSKDLEIDFDLKQPISSFSKGMQQKVQLLAATVHKPKILIFDEPFSGLDPLNSQVIKREISNLSKEGTTILMSTHRMDTFEDLCNSFLFLKKGQILAKGAKESFMPKHSLIHLKVKNPLNNLHFNLKNYQVKDQLHEYLIDFKGPVHTLIPLLLEQSTEIVSIAPHTETLEDIFIQMNKSENHA